MKEILGNIFVFALVGATFGIMIWRDMRDDGYSDRAGKKLVKRILKEIKAGNVWAHEESDKKQKLYWYDMEIPKRNANLVRSTLFFSAQYDGGLDNYYLKYFIPMAKHDGGAVQDIFCSGREAKKVWDALMISYPRIDHIQEKEPNLDSHDACMKYLNDAVRKISKERQNLQKEKKW